MHPKKINLALLALLSVLMPLTPNVTAPFSMSQVLAQTPSSPKPEADRPNGVQVKDVPGWNNTRWGMTIKEVQALYPFRNTEPSPDGANQVGLLTSCTRTYVLCTRSSQLKLQPKSSE